jgi:hypothetical protein
LPDIRHPTSDIGHLSTLGAVPQRQLLSSSRTFGVGPALLAALFVLIAISSLFLRHESHWSVDSAVQELMIKRVAESGLRGLTLGNAATEVDPEGHFMPRLFLAERGDEYVFAFRPVIAVLGAVPYEIAGRAGLPVLPILGALALGWVAALGARRIRPEAAGPAVVLLLLLSPVLLYSVTLWDHLPGTAMMAGGVYLIWRYGLEGTPRLLGVALGGMLIGLAPLFRNEAYIFAVAALAAWIISAPRARAIGALVLLVGLSAGWVVNAAWNYVVYGTFVALLRAADVAAGHGALLQWAQIGDFLSLRLWNLYLFVVAPNFQAREVRDLLMGVAAFAPVVLAAGLMALRNPERRLGPITAALWLVGLATIWVLAQRGQVTGFFWVAPYLVLAFVYRPASPLRRFLWVLALTFSAGVIWTAGAHGGYQWGPRYLLAAYPLAVWLTVDAWTAASDAVRRAVRAPAVVLLVLAGLAQAAGVDHADTAAWQASGVVHALRTAQTDYIATGVEGFAWFFAPHRDDRKILTVDSPEELRELVQTLLRARLERFTYVPRDAFFDPRIIERERTGGASYRLVEDRNYLGMRLIEYHLVPPP